MEIQDGGPELRPAGKHCMNADNPGAWWCYHRNGKIIIGTELKPGQTHCRACQRAIVQGAELPSFLQPESEL